MAESRLNIELFKKIRNRIAEIPESYNQRTFVSDSVVAPCGTVCCIAGEAIICNAPSVAEGIIILRSMDEENAPNGSNFGSLIPHTAQELLGLSDAEADALFEYAEQGWPEPFRSQYILASDKALVAVLLLDHIISTGEVLE